MSLMLGWAAKAAAHPCTSDLCGAPVLPLYPMNSFPPGCSHCCCSSTSGSAGNSPSAWGLCSRTRMAEVSWLREVSQLRSALWMFFRHLTRGRRPVGSKRGEVANCSFPFSSQRVFGMGGADCVRCSACLCRPPRAGQLGTCVSPVSHH